MTFVRNRKRLTAWLGLVAMVLIFIAPVVSQQLALRTSLAPVEHAGTHCEAMPVASADSDMPAGHDMPASHHAACGYCNLLAHHVPAPVPVAPMAMPAPARTIAWAAAPERFAVHEARRAGRPRDSPFLT